VLSAPLTPNAAEAVRSLHLAGFTVTVVSNNSTDAIRSFLVLHELAAHVRVNKPNKARQSKNHGADHVIDTLDQLHQRGWLRQG
jgi:phosphoglycolate phosphatase-like HAD superfamily hydrolase